MRPVERSEILPLGEYETIRPRFRARVVEEKRARRVKLGEHISAVFENRDSVLLQIQEMLRTERITSESGIAHELETYNDLIPEDGQLSLTLFVEIAEKEVRDRVLVELAGLEGHVGIEVDGAYFPATEKLGPGAVPERTTAVHYFKIAIGPEARAAIDRKDVRAAVVVKHPNYQARAELGPEALAKIAEDLGRDPAVIVFERAIKFEEVDAAAIVFFSRFVEYAHEAMEHFFGALDGGYAGLIVERRIGLPAVRVEMSFASPLRYGDAIRIETRVRKVGNRSATFEYRMMNKKTGALAAEVTHTVVTTDLAALRSCEMPADVRAQFLAHLEPLPQGEA